MIRRAAACSLALTLGLSACAPITAYHGYQVIEANPAELKVGVDSKSSVMEKLGSPSVVSTFEPDVWYYMSQVNDQVAFYKPTVTKRTVYAIAFDKASQQVASVDTYGLK
ncbi:MAG: outer membrane protein assembly factor BamE, partial [Caulobacteraceae bacterium]